jgi:hypothetical protein
MLLIRGLGLAVLCLLVVAPTALGHDPNPRRSG